MKEDFLKDPRFWISLLLLAPAWFIAWAFPESNQHMILASGILGGVAGYWLGAGFDQFLGGKKDETAPKAPGPIVSPVVPGVKLRQPGDDKPAVG